jgi:hypothetical protein
MTTTDTELFFAFKRAIRAAIEEVGLEQFKKTSMFASNKCEVQEYDHD